MAVTAATRHRGLLLLLLLFGLLASVAAAAAADASRGASSSSSGGRIDSWQWPKPTQEGAIPVSAKITTVGI